MTHESIRYDTIADRLIDLAIEDERIRALWIEGASREELRRPYRGLEPHLAADEPLFPALVGDLEALLARKFTVNTRAVRDTPRHAKAFDLALGLPDHAADCPLTLVIEQTCYLAKRPRAWVVPLHDKTTRLCHVMDFSVRRR